MRRLQQLICFLFVVSCIVAGIYLAKHRMVEDHIPPVITAEENEITVSVQDGDSALVQGLHAEDNRDGDLTSQIRVSSMSHFIEKGKRMISYIVFDSANQPATLQRTLYYSDYESPRIYIQDPLVWSKNDLYNKNLLENVTASDCLDGDLTNMVHVTTSNDFYEDSDRGKLTYFVSNSAGDVTSIDVSVELVDWSSAKQSLKLYPALTQYVTYTKVGQKVDAKKFIQGLFNRSVTYDFERDGDYIEYAASDIKIKSNVDYDTPGVYTIEYSLTNEDLVSATTYLYVVVE